MPFKIAEKKQEKIYCDRNHTRTISSPSLRGLYERNLQRKKEEGLTRGEQRLATIRENSELQKKIKKKNKKEWQR